MLSDCVDAVDCVVAFAIAYWVYEAVCAVCGVVCACVAADCDVV